MELFFFGVLTLVSLPVPEDEKRRCEIRRFIAVLYLSSVFFFFFFRARALFQY